MLMIALLMLLYVNTEIRSRLAARAWLGWMRIVMRTFNLLVVFIFRVQNRVYRQRCWFNLEQSGTVAIKVQNT